MAEMGLPRFLSACRLEPVDRTPVWFMRQAGRHQPEYRQLRERYDFLTLCTTPELASRVTLIPLHWYPVDAAILFSDILLPLIPMGLELQFPDGERPVISNPLRNEESIRKLRSYEPEEALAFVLEAIRIVCRELGGRKPLIGFSGAPFTLASYAIEGGHSEDYRQTRDLMTLHPKWWKSLMKTLSRTVTHYLLAQIQAGVQAVQLFDSWAGVLTAKEYQDHVLPYSKEVIDVIQGTGVPLIHFGTRTGPFLEIFEKAGAGVVGVDWRVPLDEAWRRIGYRRAIQGNLDPSVLLKPVREIREEVRSVLEQAGGRPGHIFNLGHGILPETQPEHVLAAVETVQQYRAKHHG